MQNTSTPTMIEDPPLEFEVNLGTAALREAINRLQNGTLQWFVIFNKAGFLPIVDTIAEDYRGSIEEFFANFRVCTSEIVRILEPDTATVVFPTVLALHGKIPGTDEYPLGITVQVQSKLRTFTFIYELTDGEDLPPSLVFMGSDVEHLKGIDFFETSQIPDVEPIFA